MKPLDIVKTPKGQYGLVTETADGGKHAGIVFLDDNPLYEKNSWWREGDGLQVVNSLPRLLALIALNPFGRGRDDVNLFYPLETS